ncbi:FKBP-type peptidyl-prolyl cis-trans isomerase [Algivirga pacifica]|uniref:Peptidyl-prolyl cis-trans isomerase n=1 Tax=Algivirga pacifica TaxID=1162670 RepID=A0ABP9DKX1_9BACT
MIRHLFFGLLSSTLLIFGTSCEDDGELEDLSRSAREDRIIRTHLEFDLDLVEGSSFDRTEDGIYYFNHTEGSGTAIADDNDSLRLKYTGWVLYGDLFDSSVLTDNPFEVVLDSADIAKGIPVLTVTSDTTSTFKYNPVIQGWQKALRLMKEGDSTRFFIPSELGYGNAGSGSLVPANAILVFDIKVDELIKQ